MKFFTEKNEKALFFGICAICLIIIAGCSRKSGSYSSKQSYGVNSSAKVAARASQAAMADSAYFDSMDYEVAEEAMVNGKGYNDGGPIYEGGNEGPAYEYERKLIRTGNVSLEVQTVTDAEDKIAQWAASLGGYVTNANTWQYGAGFTVRVPSARFDEAMSQVGSFGRITNRSVSSQDVSDNYYDMKSRLETKYILRDKLQSYLSEAKDIKDLLEVERQLNEVIEDIESTESRFKRLSGQIDYSTIYINMSFEHGKDEGGIILPDVKNSWNEFVSNVINFFWNLLKVLFYIVIFGIPIIAVAALLFWLLFGKIGLLVKLFKKLKKQFAVSEPVEGLSHGLETANAVSDFLTLILRSKIESV